MIDILSMAVSQGAKQLESQPLLFYIFKKWPRAESIVKRAVEKLSDEVTVCFCFDDALVSKCVGNCIEYFSLLY